MNQTHLRSQSDPNWNTSSNGFTGYTSLSPSPMQRLSSPTIRTHISSIRSFPFFSSGGSTFSHSMRQQSSPPVTDPIAIQRDETAVTMEPFNLAHSRNYNPDRKQADGSFPIIMRYDPPRAIAPPTVHTEVQSSNQTPRGRTQYNPPAYTELSSAFPEAGGSSSSRGSPPTVGQARVGRGFEDTQHSFTSRDNTVTRKGYMVNHLAPPTNASLNVLTGHRPQWSGDTNSSGMDSKRRLGPDTEDNFSVKDIA